MGLFSTLFGQSARQELAKSLAVNRIAELNIDEIDSTTQDQLIAHIQKMSAIESMALPETTIITIVYTYAELIQKRVPHTTALLRIEDHRAKIGSRPVDFKTMSLDDYVAYRFTVELENGPSPGMDDYWFNGCMLECCKHCHLPWHGGATYRPRITRPA